MKKHHSFSEMLYSIAHYIKESYSEATLYSQNNQSLSKYGSWVFESKENSEDM